MRSLLLIVLLVSAGSFASEVKHDFLYQWDGKTTTVYVSNAGREEPFKCRWVYKNGDLYEAQLLNDKGDFWSVPVTSVKRIEGTVLSSLPPRTTRPDGVLNCKGGYCVFEKK